MKGTAAFSVIVLLGVNRLAAADECDDAMAIWMAMDTNCPKNCDESQDGVCTNGKKERDPSVCGPKVAPKCAMALENLDSIDKVKTMLAGFATGTGNCKSMESFGKQDPNAITFGYMGGIFTDCGLEAPYVHPPKDECWGAALTVMDLNRKCPARCNDETDNRCTAGENAGKPARDVDTCGAKAAPGCQDFVQMHSNEAVAKTLMTGFGKCEGNPALEQMAGSMVRAGAERFQQMVESMGDICSGAGERADTPIYCGDVKKIYKEGCCKFKNPKKSGQASRWFYDQLWDDCGAIQEKRLLRFPEKKNGNDVVKVLGKVTFDSRSRHEIRAVWSNNALTQKNEKTKPSGETAGSVGARTSR